MLKPKSIVMSRTHDGKRFHSYRYAPSDYEQIKWEHTLFDLTFVMKRPS